MRLFFSFVAIVTCAISYDFSVLAADEEPVAESPSQESPSATGKAEEKPEVPYSSPSGAVRLERTGEDIWVVSAKDSAQRAKLPKVQILGDWGCPDEFDFSPDDEWIFAPYHVGDDFQELVWSHAAKLKLVKANCNEGCAMIFFAGWSGDSSRLLVGLRCGDKPNLEHCYIYFNTRAKKFEITDYLRKLNKTKSEALACAEPVDPLPNEAELKTRFDSLDRRLNEKYTQVLAHSEKDRIPVVRETQRDWIKHRDEGAKLYTSVFPAAEKERRRLQFLGDVTAARIGTPAEEWEVER